MDLATLQTGLLALWDPTLLAVFLRALFLGMLIVWCLFVEPAQERVEALEGYISEWKAHLDFEQQNAATAQTLAHKSIRSLKKLRYAQCSKLWPDAQQVTSGAQEAVPSDSEELDTAEPMGPV